MFRSRTIIDPHSFRLRFAGPRGVAGGGGGGVTDEPFIYIGFDVNVHDIDDWNAWIVMDPDWNYLYVYHYRSAGTDYISFWDETDVPYTILNTWVNIEMKIDFTDPDVPVVLPRIDGVSQATFIIDPITSLDIQFGAIFGSSDTDLELDNLTIGTSDWGSSELFGADFDDFSIVPPFDSTVGSFLDASGGTLLIVDAAGSESYAIKELGYLPYVMQADASSGDSYITKDWGSDQDEVWITYEIAFSSEALAFWSPGQNFSGNFSAPLTSSNSQLGGVCIEDDFDLGLPLWEVFTPYGASYTPTPTANTWQLIEFRFRDNGTTRGSDVYIDGTLAISNTSSGDSLRSRKLRLGLSNGADLSPDAIVYFKNIKVGTTRGDSDLFLDDFSSGDFSNWDSVTGDCFLVFNPYS